MEAGGEQGMGHSGNMAHGTRRRAAGHRRGRDLCGAPGWRTRSAYLLRALSARAPPALFPGSQVPRGLAECRPPG